MKITVVGFGIAGALSAYSLWRAGFRVRVVVSTTAHTSSNVAGGLITPITGQRCTPTWRITELLPLAQTTYSQFAGDGKGLWQTITQRRIFRNAREREFFCERLANNEYSGIELHHNPNTQADGIGTPFGSMDMYSCVMVNMPATIAHIRDTLQAEGVEFVHTTCEANDVLNPPIGEHYLWCIGNAVGNALWNWIPLLPSKGETLIAEIAGWNVNYVLNSGVWIAPLGSMRYRVGSTHTWDDLTTTPTQAAREYLQQHAQELLGRSIKIIDHQAGIRPATQHRLPFVGVHPDKPQHCIFTGLGAKGALYAPFVVQCLKDYYTNGKPLPKEFGLPDTQNKQ